MIFNLNILTTFLLSWKDFLLFNFLALRAFLAFNLVGEYFLLSSLAKVVLAPETQNWFSPSYQHFLPAPACASWLTPYLN
jgi:hypothetical protein